MSSHNSRRLSEHTMIPDDLDQLLREAMREQMGGATPPDHVWQRIEHQLRGGPSPVRRRASIRARRTAPLVQALALASLVVVFTASLGQTMSWSLLLEPYGQERSTPTAAAAARQWPSLAERAGESSVRQAPLLAKERELEQQMRHGVASAAESIQGALIAEEQKLSKHENVLLSREQAGRRPSDDSKDSSLADYGPPRHREVQAQFGDAP